MNIENAPHIKKWESALVQGRVQLVSTCFDILLKISYFEEIEAILSGFYNIFIKNLT